jgi:hypothetical protein
LSATKRKIVTKSKVGLELSFSHCRKAINGSSPWTILSGLSGFTVLTPQIKPDTPL